jgi:hypothetical protein
MSHKSIHIPQKIKPRGCGKNLQGKTGQNDLFYAPH